MTNTSDYIMIRQSHSLVTQMNNFDFDFDLRACRVLLIEMSLDLTFPFLSFQCIHPSIEMEETARALLSLSLLLLMLSK